MTPSRGAFLAGTTAVAIAAPTLVAAASAADVAAATRGMTFTTLRDGGVDHVGVRTAEGIVDIGRPAPAWGAPLPALTADDVVAGRGNVAALPHLINDAPARAIRSESSVQYGPVVGRAPRIT